MRTTATGSTRASDTISDFSQRSWRGQPPAGWPAVPSSPPCPTVCAMPDQQPPEPATATEADETPAPESAEPAPGTGSGSPAAAADQPGATVTVHRGGG